LIRAIESYLRGGCSYADQLFLINRGVVEDTTQNILAISITRPKEVLQSCFDMLGELIKFNIKGFAKLDNEITDPAKFNLLLSMVQQNLVDSNMFLRSIFLSINFFDKNAAALSNNLAFFQNLELIIVFLLTIFIVYRLQN
jgi:Trpc4-associated protein